MKGKVKRYQRLVTPSAGEPFWQNCGYGKYKLQPMYERRIIFEDAPAPVDNTKEIERRTANMLAIILTKLAKKHNVPENDLVVGIHDNEILVQKVVGIYEIRLETLENLPLMNDGE